MPIAPYQAARWWPWFMASVATRSPGLTAEPLKRLGELAGVPRHAGPGGAGFAAIGPAGDDFAPAMLACGVVDQPRYAQLEILHAA